MKGVDIVAEFDAAYVYIEMKDYDDPSAYDVVRATSDDEKRSRQDSFKWLKNYLKYKYRDSYLYRHAEQKVDKPIHYICLITFDNALNTRMQKALKQELPVGKSPRRWVQTIATSCQVVNLETVSYTHLDVYKRQLLTTSSIAPPATWGNFRSTSQG